MALAKDRTEITETVREVTDKEPIFVMHDYSNVWIIELPDVLYNELEQINDHYPVKEIISNESGYISVVIEFE